MKFALRGLKQLEENLNKLIDDLDDITDEALDEIAQGIYDRSQKMVPVDTGRLKESGEIVQLGKLHWMVHYQAFDPLTGYEYAPIQHEVLDFHHEIGQAKYLELAIDMSEVKSILKKYFG
jgi:hypothetical protein